MLFFRNQKIYWKIDDGEKKMSWSVKRVLWKWYWRRLFRNSWMLQALSTCNRNVNKSSKLWIKLVLFRIDDWLVILMEFKYPDIKDFELNNREREERVVFKFIDSQQNQITLRYTNHFRLTRKALYTAFRLSKHI